MAQVEQIFEGSIKPAFSLSLVYTYAHFENLTIVGYSNYLFFSEFQQIILFVGDFLKQQMHNFRFRFNV